MHDNSSPPFLYEHLFLSDPEGVVVHHPYHLGARRWCQGEQHPSSLTTIAFVLSTFLARSVQEARGVARARARGVGRWGVLLMGWGMLKAC